MQFFIIMQAENTSHPNHFSNGPHVLSEKNEQTSQQNKPF